MKFTRHLFVCTQIRPGGGKPACGQRGGAAIVAAIERVLAARPELTAQVTGCACLGPCFDGPNAVVYPDGVWYAGLGVEDAPALVEHLATGALAAARRYTWPDDGDDDA